ncbi:MAG TPA: SGNH/GDSL hydrolase family protein [Planctomycetaceae bacterium]|nr:SGNH/GDSL hydrolase family protein [Planctomycetaceae bacterium]
MPFDLPFDYVAGMALWLAGLALGLRQLLKSRRRIKIQHPARFNWANLGLSVWMFLAALTAVELYFATIYDQSDAFNATNVSRHWFARHVEPMQKVLQFRDGQATLYRDARAFPTKLSAGQHPICFIGDSFTFGHGVPNVADRFSDRVGAALERKAPGGFVVSNLADAGRELHWGEALLEELAADRLPVKTVIYVICLNDIETFDDRTATLFEGKGSWVSGLFLLRHTYFLNLLYNRVRQAGSEKVGGYYALLQDCYAGPAWERMRAKLDDIRRLCERNGMDLRIVVFPFLHDLGPDYSFGEAHRRITDYCREAGVPVLDLRRVLDPHVSEGLTVNRFDPHPNERAHALAAEAIEKDLLGDLTGE